MLLDKNLHHKEKMVKNDTKEETVLGKRKKI